MKRTTVNTLFLAVLMATFTIGAIAQTPQVQPNPGMMDMTMMQSCPMTIEGASVEVSDGVNGVNVAVTTKTGDVADLRRRVEMMAKMHSDASNMPMPGMMDGKMMAFTAKYEEVQDGARVTLSPKDPAQMHALRDQVLARAEQMKKGDCSMMQNMMKGMMDSMMDGKMGTTEGMKQSTPDPKAPPKADEPDHSSHH